MEELEKELEKIEQQLFMLEMQDGWQKEDFELSYELEAKYKKIKEEIEKCKKN